MSGGSALTRIELELIALAEEAETHGQPVDPYQLRIIARKINAQAEIAEIGLGEA